MTPAFESDRLRVYAADLKPSDQCVERRVYIAFQRDVDCPYPVATMTVWVVEPHRRRGIASELWRAVERHIGRECVGDAISDEGRALLAIDSV